MSKKKNTLKDLDEFLKQQAATIVPPSKLSEKIPDMDSSVSQTITSEDVPLFERIIEELNDLSRKERTDFRHKLYDLILQSVESRAQAEPGDTLLINTVLYLKSGDRWKEMIRAYWGNRYKKVP
jgi:hypothetical protein